MAGRDGKTAIFIDGANLNATSKELGFDVDFKRLLSEFQGASIVVRAFYYAAVAPDGEFNSIAPLLDWLNYNGFTVATKATKEFAGADGRRALKGNMESTPWSSLAT